MERQTARMRRAQVVALASVAVLLWPVAGWSQTADQRAAGQAATQKSAVPRTPWGHPDLQGFWTNTTTTPLERPADLADKAVLTEAEWKKRNAEVAERVSSDRRSAGSVGSYNEFWMERGALNNRTSLVIDPPDGKIPPMTPAGKARQDGLSSRRREHPADSWEDRSAYDRCITRSMPGVMMPGFYNHNYHILQTPTHVVLVAEMIHDARIIPIDGRPHLPGTIRQWLGDSRGHWEGDTLVVDTAQFTPHKEGLGMGGFPSSARKHLIERFTLNADGRHLDYEVVVEDPEYLRAPLTYRSQWDYRPDLAPTGLACDLDVARRFLTEP